MFKNFYSFNYGSRAGKQYFWFYKEGLIFSECSTHLFSANETKFDKLSEQDQPSTDVAALNVKPSLSLCGVRLSIENNSLILTSTL